MHLFKQPVWGGSHKTFRNKPGKPYDLHDVENALKPEIQRLEEVGMNPQGQMYALIVAVCSFMLKPRELAQPFGPVLRMADSSRSAISEDLSDNHMAFLWGAVEQVRNPSLRARLADVVWLEKREIGASPYEAAKASVQAYYQVCES